MEEIKALLKEIPGNIGTASIKERKHVFEQLEKAIKTGMHLYFIVHILKTNMLIDFAVNDFSLNRLLFRLY